MDPTAKPITRDRLLDDYAGYGVPPERWRVGGEFERHLLRGDGSTVPYFGPHGVLWLLEQLQARGWQGEHEDGHLIALRRDDQWITLEPGGQFELSGSPYSHLEGVVTQAKQFVEEVRAAIGEADIRPVALGFTPYARIEEIPWVPKGRYGIMKRVLAQQGDLAHHMMKGTAAVQASFDFRDEEDAARKVRLAVLLGPLTTAMFANSPLVEGKPCGFMSWRGHVWTRTDPDRTGFPDAAENFSFERWVDYLLDVPMMFVRIGGRWTDAQGRTFRHWMEHGIDGVFPTRPDWDLHQTSVFPEVRIKRTIEVRGADCVGIPLASAFVALFKGLLYCRRATDDAMDLAERFAHEGTSAERFAVACRGGLQGEVGGRRLADWAEQLLTVGRAGMSRCDPEDLPYLEPLEAQIATGRSPAADVLEAWERDPRPHSLLETIAYTR